MEETKKKTASQPEKAKKDNKNDSKKDNKGGQFLAEHRAEMRKITWPNREELAKETVTVIVISLIVGAIIFCMDTALAWSYNKIMGARSGSSNTNTVDTSTPIDLSSLPEGVEVITGDAAETTPAPAGSVDVEAPAPAADEAPAQEAGNADEAANNANEGAADSAANAE